MSDFLKCPRAYYLRNVYKDPKTGHKMSITNPSLALGQTVHEVIEGLSVLPTDKRFNESLIAKFDRAWQKVSGKRGGFFTMEDELRYKKRGEEMLQRVMANPGPLKNLAVKIKMDLPNYWLSETDGIILCGKIDWLEYFPDTDTVHIIDFKTGKNDEDPESLQLPIYHLLVANCQKRQAVKASYWYLGRNDAPIEVPLPDLEDARQRVLKIAKEVKLARKLEIFKCPQQTGCFACKPFEAVLRGEAEFVGLNEYKQDLYVLKNGATETEGESEVL